MKRFTAALIVVMILMTSKISMASGDPLTSKSTTTTGGRAQTATRNAVVHANIPRIPRFKVLRSNPYRTVHRVIDDSSDDFIDDDGLMTSYRRRDLDKIDHPDGLSEKVRWRLFLARQLALAKHREKFG